MFAPVHPAVILFARGTLARLALWPTLRLAVHASWGGPASAEKRRWLAGVLVDQFEPYLVPSSSSSTNTTTTVATTSALAAIPTPAPTPLPPPPDEPYIEDLLLQIMSDEFDVDVQDDSCTAVARDLVRLFDEIGRSGPGPDALALVTDLEAQADKAQGSMPKYEIGNDGSEDEGGSRSEWEDEEDEADDEAMDQDGEAPQLLNHSEPQVDEDGFTIVKKKGRR